MASTGKIKESLEFFQTTIQKHRRFGIAYIELGRLLERAKQFSQAAGVYEGCIKATQKFPNCFLNLVKLYNALGKAEDSQRVLEGMLKHFDDFAQGHHILAMMYRDKQEGAKAEVGFANAVKWEPRNTEFVNNLAIQMWDNVRRGRRGGGDLLTREIRTQHRENTQTRKCCWKRPFIKQDCNHATCIRIWQTSISGGSNGWMQNVVT
eukprot:TRINITY_DN1775_c0_g2_i3.p1 TRINITY_DN1775_c0_g2~~TRINITY_DN1775_c0_g2_i3.p1  ORF type:complete len:207 (-),score=26.87 TRINITY_DN1775_c0_g2_i3:266-886(-)